MPINAEGLIVLDKAAQLKPYKPRSFIEREFLSDQELLDNAGGTLFFDIECYPNWYCCNFKLWQTNKFLVMECGQDKSFNPKMLSWIMNNYRTVGFNSISYDNLMLWLSYHDQDTYRLKDASNDIILRGMRKQELQKEYQFFAFKTNHIDLIEVSPLKGSLKLYMARLHAQRIQELPIPDTKELTADEIEIVTHYNFNDLDGTELLFDFMKERIELRESMGVEYQEDLRSKSDAQMAEVVLSKEVGKINGKRPKRAEIETGTTYRYSIPNYIKYQSDNLKFMLGQIRIAKFIVNSYGKIDLPDELKGSVKIGKGEYRLGIGGLHSSEKNIAYKASDNLSIVDRDVASYYPRIITTLGLYPQSMGQAFLEAYNKIIDVRLAAKKNKVFSRDKGLKIVINGTSGKFSDFWSSLYAPDLTIQVTVTGQLALLMLIEMLEENGVEVISANTDGIVMLVPKEKEQTAALCAKVWENETGFETEETRYKGYFARDVNSYFAVKTDDSIRDKVTGELKEKDRIKKKGPYSEVGSQSGTKLDTNPIVLICSDAVEKLLADNIPIERTIKESKDFTRFLTVRQAKSPGAHKNGEYLGKVLRWYYAKGELGCIQTVQTNNKIADSDGAKPCMDLPNSFPDDIDYEWYINHTKEILEDIGYIRKPKQLQFF
jgi:hypothetical protein